MTNSTTIRNLFGKTLAIAFFAAIMTVASYAQTNRLFYQSNGASYGRVTVFPGSHFQIDSLNGGGVIKTFRNSCAAIPGSAAPGLQCAFGHFNAQGIHVYSGRGLFFQNGLVYLRWTNENLTVSTGGPWRMIDTGWYGFRP